MCSTETPSRDGDLGEWLPPCFDPFLPEFSQGIKVRLRVWPGGDRDGAPAREVTHNGLCQVSQAEGREFSGWAKCPQ